MPQSVPVYFAPDFDNAWSAHPGALASMNAFAPLQLGAYGSVGTANLFGSSTIANTGVLTGYMFRQVNGTVRFIVGDNAGNLDEYDSSLSKTNRAALASSPVNWNMAAWGNQIIAVDYVDAPQSSTGAGFTGLAGSPPKARLIAANQNFVMLADTDDGANQYSDQVWWSAIQNPTSWTPAIATQAGNYRILDAPGPIRALVAYNDTFIAFKDNAMFLGTYQGPPYIWGWQAISRHIGCVGAKAVKELDGKLYFLHTSGFYEFDGQSIRNVGLPVFRSYLSSLGYVSDVLGIGGAVASVDLSGVQTVADDLEGIVWFMSATVSLSPANIPGALCYGYNSRSQKWGSDFRLTSPTHSGPPPALINVTTADAQAFKADSTGRVWMIWNDSTGSSTTTVQSYRYPIATTTDANSFARGATFDTGQFGSNDGSRTLSRIWHRTLAGTDDDSGITVTARGYTSENKNKTNGSATATVNSEFDVADIHLSSKFCDVAYTWSAGKKVILAGLAPEYAGQATKR